MASISEDTGEETPLQVSFLEDRLLEYMFSISCLSPFIDVMFILLSGFSQVRLNGVATFIGIVGLTVAFAVLVVLLAR